jgi:hypothetical protein
MVSYRAILILEKFSNIRRMFVTFIINVYLTYQKLGLGPFFRIELCKFRRHAKKIRNI